MIGLQGLRNCMTKYSIIRRVLRIQVLAVRTIKSRGKNADDREKITGIFCLIVQLYKNCFSVKTTCYIKYGQKMQVVCSFSHVFEYNIIQPTGISILFSCLTVCRTNHSAPGRARLIKKIPLAYYSRVFSRPLFMVHGSQVQLINYTSTALEKFETIFYIIKRVLIFIAFLKNIERFKKDGLQFDVYVQSRA